MEEVTKLRFPFTVQELVCSLKRALLDLYPDFALYPVGVGLVSQARLEVGWDLKASFNFQLGNTMSNGKTGNQWHDGYFKMDATELINGKWVNMHSKWRAFKTLDDSAHDWVNLLGTKFGGFYTLATGDFQGYIVQLKEHRYFTANLAAYSAAYLRVVKATQKTLTQEDWDLIVWE